MPDAVPPFRYLFVDEAGDLTIFGRHGRSLIGSPGVSHAFMVGLCELADPAAAQSRLDQLRADLLADSYFHGVPSFKPEQNKTAAAFHAKDDLPEVRREVFRLIPSFAPKIVVALRRKQALARELYRPSGLKPSLHSVYDRLVVAVCRDRLHSADSHQIVFARRGKRDRDAALNTAIKQAKFNFNRKWGTAHDRPVVVRSASPSEYAGLQVTDYLLWALQRLVERREDRYFGAVAGHFRLIMDLDDARRRRYGEWYSDSNPLSLEKLMPITSG
ncbi:MAG TPA: DUF3800 domain-containing protein [Gemmatimonadales bacterium]|jgi:hypothetical protein|nr:DUF3800 domain-containing protein [Gemmatimonadales bacterium]